jgi:hypothetical protein
VHTPVGARCRDCAQVRRLPQYNISAAHYARAAGAALLSGAALGIAWWLLFTARLGFFSIILGIGIGYAIGEAVSASVNRKQGPPLQVIAGVGVVLAYVVRNLAFGEGLFLRDDLAGYIAVIIGVMVAAGRLR